jgi:hypothetical protein
LPPESRSMYYSNFNHLQFTNLERHVSNFEPLQSARGLLGPSDSRIALETTTALDAEDSHHSFAFTLRPLNRAKGVRCKGPSARSDCFVQQLHGAVLDHQVSDGRIRSVRRIRVGRETGGGSGRTGVCGALRRPYNLKLIFLCEIQILLLLERSKVLGFWPMPKGWGSFSDRSSAVSTATTHLTTWSSP